jgi:cyclophilin family peptidyl-prolyl cis-trans isomerase
VAGDILLSFFPDAAPESIDHFLHLVRIGAYNTTYFGRAEAGFVLQTYNAQERLHPLTDEQRNALVPMDAELSDIPHRRGVLSFGREDNDPNSAVSSISILLGDAPHLNGKYTIVGCVEKGMDVVERMMEVRRSGRASPSVRLTIWHAEVVSGAALGNLHFEGPRPLADVLDQTAPPSLGQRAYEVLQARCLSCRSSKKRGGLDLLTRAGLLFGGEHGPAVYHGNGSSSPLLRRLTGEDKPAMPPSGPGIKPPMPADAIFPTAPKHGEVWPAHVPDGPTVWRRSVYIVTKRSNFMPFLQAFDAPDAASCARRSTTTVPTQALVLMNDPFVVARARRFAESIERTTGRALEEQVRLAFLRALSRPPDAAETTRAVRFLEEHGGSVEALADLCQVLFQTNEFVYVD